MEEEKIKFGFIPAASKITTISPDEIAKEIQISLTQHDIYPVNETWINRSIPILYLILTGGTEQEIYKLIKERKALLNGEPNILLAHPGNNSLPASLEILARLNQEGIKGKIIYLDETTNKDCWKTIERTLKYFDVFYKLRRTRIGLIGEPSEWLIASNVNSDMLKKNWGAEIINIHIDELKNMLHNITDEEIEDEHFSFVNKAMNIKEPSKKEIRNVVKIYAALKKLVDEYKIDSLSIRCFELVTDLKTTGCFALSKLNDIGIVAGCEGDIVSTLGMIWASYLTDQIPWMANPVRIDEQNNSLWLAHCTVPMGMVENYKLRSHFESGLGVGIEGELSRGKATLFRLGGTNLDKLWISNAEIIQSGAEENLCRTQALVKLHGSYKVSDLLSEPLGNHMLLLRGNYAKELLNWWEMFIGS
ncbi:MAG: fucose isomerase [Bacteroidota bacterium]|jgi:L-fucose isomerase-like protein